MKLLTAVTPILAGTALLGAPASAHHSLSRYDLAQEVLIKGKVARLDWTNPHMYLIVETEGPDGQPALVEGEGQAITQALVAGLNREALQSGTPVVMRANPNRGGWGKQVRVLDVTTEDGEIHPFYATNRQTISLTPAESLEGHYARSKSAITRSRCASTIRATMLCASSNSMRSVPPMSSLRVSVTPSHGGRAIR